MVHLCGCGSGLAYGSLGGLGWPEVLSGQSLSPGEWFRVSFVCVKR